jgi:transposase
MGLQVPRLGTWAMQWREGVARHQRHWATTQDVVQSGSTGFSLDQWQEPTAIGFDFGLWTRQIVKALVLQRFGVALSLASVGTLPARLGLTAQKPLQRAYQRDLKW